MIAALLAKYESGKYFVRYATELTEIAGGQKLVRLYDLTPDEAAFLAAVSRTTIINWYQMEYFPVVFLGNRVFIKRKEFESWIKHRKGAGTYGIHQRT